MSETPRTDFLDDTDIPSYKIWDLARELEKENTELKETIEKLENDIRRLER